jgi:LacI family transcriptional regulator
MRGIVTAMEKIHAYGYKRIGFVVPGTFDLRLGGSWTGGYIASQKLLDMAYSLPPFISKEGMTEVSFKQKFKRWLDKYEPDAILTVDGRVIPALKQLKLEIPNDVAVASTSIADIPVSAGINQNSEEIGRVAAETLISLINANDRGKPSVPRRILVEGSWVDGASLPDRRALSNKPA